MIYYFKDIENLDKKIFNNLKIYLPKSRKEKIKKITNKNQQNIRILEYFLIHKFLNLKEFEDFKYTKYGKPYLPNSKHFNISHCENFLCISFADTPVGIDVQKKVSYNEKIAKYICNDYELEQLKNSNSKDIDLTKLWIKKESFIKCLGIDISFNLKKLDYKNCTFEYYQIDDYFICECLKKR